MGPGTVLRRGTEGWGQERVRMGRDWEFGMVLRSVDPGRERRWRISFGPQSLRDKIGSTC